MCAEESIVEFTASQPALDDLGAWRNCRRLVPRRLFLRLPVMYGIEALNEGEENPNNFRLGTDCGVGDTDCRRRRTS